jgi:hypothetical protein
MDRGKAVSRFLLTLAEILDLPAMAGESSHGFTGRLPAALCGDPQTSS